MHALLEGKDEAFLYPKYEHLHDPGLLHDIEKARDRVLAAVAREEHITVFADYDADGIPGAVVMADFFRRIGYKNVSFYIPHRHDEGFGLNIGAIDECKARGTTLLITVDCGVADLDEVARANELGMDVIITDHHEPPPTGLPPAFAIVNPKLGEYSFRDLCGAATAYKLVQAIFAANKFGVKEGMEKWSLDMVGVATLSDMVPLVGENRVLARFGLDVLRKSPRPGLRALLNKLNIEQKFMNEDDIAFMITPRINAASRMGVPMDAFRLLATDDETEANALAAHLETINNERKVAVATAVKEAKRKLSAREALREVIVIGNPEWRPALAGLVANSLVEEYERPVFVWGRDGDGMLKGSCRSLEGHNLHALMTQAQDHFVEFGGHAGAGGFSATLEKIATLEEHLSQIFTATSLPAAAQTTTGIQIQVQDINENLWRILSQLAPFGIGNEKPIFEINCKVKEVRKFGKEKNHLELVLTNGIKAIEFFSSRDDMLEPRSYMLRATLEKSYFRGRPELRLRIVDIMPA